MKDRNEPLDRPAYRPANRDERRLTRRLKHVEPVIVTDSATGLVLKAVTDNVSLFGYGLHFEDPVPFARGQTVQLSFEETPTLAEARVAWSYIEGDRLNVGFERVPAKAGEMTNRPLSTLFLDLERNRSTGILRFEHGDTFVIVYFEDGRICQATSNKPATSLSRILFRLKRLTRTDVIEVEKQAAATGRPEQVILCEKEFLKQKEVLPLLRLQAEQIVARLFSWDRGTFRFEPFSLDEVKIPRMGLDPGRIVAMGMRRISNALIAPYVPSQSVPLSLGIDPFGLTGKARLDETEERILSLVNGRRTAGEIARLAGLDEESARRSLGILSGTVLVEAGEETVRASTEEIRDTDDEDLAPFLAEIDEIAARLDADTFYELLNVESTATPVDVRKQYHKLARRFHPDQHRAIPRAHREKLHDIFTKIQEAYSILSNPEMRERYDRKIGQYSAEDWAKTAQRKRSAPTSEDVFRQGQAAYKEEDYQAAAESFMWAAKMSPAKSSYQFAAAQALARVPRRGKEAEEYFKKAVELAPFNVDYLVELGRFYLASDLPSRAEAMIRKALELAPDHPAALKLLRFRR